MLKSIVKWVKDLFFEVEDLEPTYYGLTLDELYSLGLKVYEDTGDISFECRGCGVEVEIEDPELVLENYDPDYSYCGGSPYCIP